jgi:hypothetical protein
MADNDREFFEREPRRRFRARPFVAREMHPGVTAKQVRRERAAAAAVEPGLQSGTPAPAAVKAASAAEAGAMPGKRRVA